MNEGKEKEKESVHVRRRAYAAASPSLASRLDRGRQPLCLSALRIVCHIFPLSSTLSPTTSSFSFSAKRAHCRLPSLSL